MKQSWSQTPEMRNECVVCSTEFFSKRSARYCSDHCRYEARYKRRGQPDPALRAQWRKLRIERNPEVVERTRRQWNALAARRRAFINRYKLLVGCVDCGYREHAVALDIDHIDGKTLDIPKLRSIAAIKAEIRRHKCEVRCANCHRVRTHVTGR